MKPMRVDGGGDPRDLRVALVAFALFLVVVAIFFLVGCSLKSAQIAHVGIQSADLVSTAHAESRGAVEANPVMQTNTATRIALKSAQTAGVIWITRELAKRGHEKLSRGLLYALNAAMVGIVTHNLQVMR